MPYAQRDAWHRQMREYLDRRKRLSSGSRDTYRYVLEKAGTALDLVHPRDVRLEEMESLAGRVPEWRSQNTRAWNLRIVRAFLRWAGNRQARDWEIMDSPRPAVDGVFLSELEVAHVRTVAHSLGLEHELLFSLGVDNGLRSVDMRRLTVKNAQEAIRTRVSEIRGKGRNGGKVAPQVFNRMTVPLLYQYLQVRRQMVDVTGMDSDLFLVRVSRNGKTKGHLVSWSPEYLGHLTVGISEAAAIDFRCHDMRRTCGNRLHRAGQPIEMIAKVLRHECPDLTFKCYIGIMREEMLDAIDALTPETCPERPIQTVNIAK